ncbi:molecular chaperone DnaJ [Granulosicoccaceae sp. 1_MG-2023]|nr:molecular chaperone DnaJ [Granulosicoccaceae sp. 1_MG-2023]
MGRLILLLSLVAIGYIVYHLYLRGAKAPSKSQWLRYGAIALGLFFVVMVLTGRAPAVFAALGAALAAAFRYFPLLLRHWPQLRSLYSKHAGGGRVSRVTTAVLVMTLDHDSGHMDGDITAGEFAGRRLSELSIEELKRFHRFCQAQDAQAVQVLEAYLQRERAGQWDDSGDSGREQRSARATGMSEDEAREILGVAADAGREEIINAHRRLMSRLHPDKGGSDYLAARVNEAKKVLLG